MRAVFEKTPASSKKFIAYVLAELISSAVLIVALIQWRDGLDGWAFGVVITMCTGRLFLEIGYILGQVYVDKFVRLAHIAAEAAVSAAPGGDHKIDVPDAPPPPPAPQARILRRFEKPPDTR